MKWFVGLLMVFVVVGFGLVWGLAAQGGETVYLPVAYKTEPTPTPTPMPQPLVEFRGVWVTRFDWTNGRDPASPAKIDEIVNNVAAAGFNAILFQVRSTGDTFYDSDLEPWSARMSAVGLGVPPNPYWDPLAYLVQQAHARGIQVHAYINVYPVWTNISNCTVLPDPNARPLHVYYLLQQWHGSTNGKNNGLQWGTNGAVYCGSYLRATPASDAYDNHLLAIGQELVTRYDVDGIHLDHIRYEQASTSCDPVSYAVSGTPCFSYPPFGYGSYGDWQRAQVNGTVRKFYEQIVPLKPGLWLTAAVWPVYLDYWGWGSSEGYNTFYQDSKAWLAGSYIDAIAPMIYGGTTWDSGELGRQRWRILVQDFQGSRNGRYIIPGIGTDYADFYDIAARITAARELGTAGHALFSYGALYTRGYFDELANGPYAQTAVPPSLPWHQ
jgi:uncharacterized lipoprotein YddW (UPF0748 family)